VAEKRKVIIVGGVAGGASAAARLRRQDEQAEITMYERGEFVSFANCGLPYYVGEVIATQDKLLLANPKLFKDRFNIAVKTRHEVVAVDRAAKTVRVRDLSSGQEFSDAYTHLILSPGALAIRPPLPGIDLPGIFVVRSIPDSEAIRGWIGAHQAGRAVVIGGGFIGLEMAENLQHRGLDVTIVEMLNQVMPPVDPEMAQYVAQHLTDHGIKLALGDGVAGMQTNSAGGLLVTTQGGKAYPADLVILAIGVRPDTALAKAAGLELGQRGGIKVNAHMQTSDPAVYAVGDAVEVFDTILKQWTLLALAGPANRQGRVAADHICGRAASFRGVQGTAICGVFDLAIASTGASEKALQRAQVTDYQVIYLHPNHHVGYYPGAEPIRLKLIFRPSDGRILGAQAVGKADVARKIDVIAMAMQKDGTVYDLEEAELCYAPQYGGAKDAINMAGMIAANHQRHEHPLAAWSELKAPGVLLDVREPSEFTQGHIAGAVLIPLGQLRQRTGELPHDQVIRVYCAAGQRGYYAARMLNQLGFQTQNLSGGYGTYLQLAAAGKL